MRHSVNCFWNCRLNEQYSLWQKKHHAKHLTKHNQETFREGLKLCTALLARHFAKSSNREILFWTVQAEEAEKRGEAMAKEKVLLPQFTCYFKEKTETRVQVLEEGNSIRDLLPSLPCTPQVVAVGVLTCSIKVPRRYSIEGQQRHEHGGASRCPVQVQT
ncbi:uncharacterized protein LOC115319518 isoform X2 [Ixodes scapularis]|uniref:uncharacterized protein LOC115319518 isoform X2 n=1 Tax=Ixodes scapularis TaxID=6945 RepID=UPI001C38B87A|nr:uncharacterized protein LOC115319518 isoform X2 [Ixodes scapularis]